MVFLNGEFVDQNQAKISVLDRGFLFGDGVYEVIPVYNHTIFALDNHLQRLDKNLTLTKIPNPLTSKEYQGIFTTLIKQNPYQNQSIYLQITRGTGAKREHNFYNLTPTIYISTSELKIKEKNFLKQGFNAIIQDDMRWQHCNIKSISLLANVLYVDSAKQNNCEEIILHRDNIITEGASSNVFVVKDNIVYTPKLSNYILAGITRDMVLKSCKIADICYEEVDITTDELLNADEVWISSSTREIMPIKNIDNKEFQVNTPIWNKVYSSFQDLKTNG